MGNVGQLATDLLISTLSMKRVGYLHDDSFLPLVGNNPFCLGNMTGSNELVTAVEGKSVKSVRPTNIIILKWASF